LTIAFVTRIRTVTSHGLRDDARLVPCGSHLWAMQPMWSTATIEIHPYKYPSHCKNLLVTLITLWLPIGLLWYQTLIA